MRAGYVREHSSSTSSTSPTGTETWAATPDTGTKTAETSAKTPPLTLNFISVDYTIYPRNFVAAGAQTFYLLFPAFI
jgi:hypothetical protein